MRIFKRLIAVVVALAVLVGLFFAGVGIAAKIHNQTVWDEIRSWGQVERQGEVVVPPLS
jgi:putative heme iron utilization protein